MSPSKPAARTWLKTVSETPPAQPREAAVSAQRKFTRQEALQFHSEGKPGKLEIVPTKPMATQRDLSLAYSPGVAVPVEAIAENARLVYDYTAKGNLVASGLSLNAKLIAFERHAKADCRVQLLLVILRRCQSFLNHLY